MAVARAVVGAPVSERVSDIIAPFVRALPAADRMAIGALLHGLELAPLISRHAGRFSNLEPQQAEAYLRSWAVSRIPQQRQGAAALRALALLAHYGSEESWADVGYRGPWLGRKQISVLPVADLSASPVSAPRRNRPRPSVGLPPGVTRGREQSGDLRIRAQVCVIGTGAGGAAALARLSELGITAVAVEAGPYTGAADFNQRELDMLPHLYQDAGLRATGDQSIGIMQGTGVGGSTLHNTGLVFSPPGGILERWRREHGFALPEDAVKRQVSRIFGLLQATEIPADRINGNNEALRRGADALGWSHRTALHNRASCSACGYCMLGCAYNRKYNAAISLLPGAIAAGASIIADASALRIEGGAGARRVICELRNAEGQPTGRIATVEADRVILAAGALDSPALLLRSGLGGSRAGRGLRLHPAAAVSGVFAEPVIAWRGLPQAVIVDEFSSFERDGYGGWLFLPSAANTPGLASLLTPGFGADHRARMLELPHIASASVLLHDETEGRVTTSSSGRPVASYWPSADDRRELERGIFSLARLYLAGGAERVLLPYPNLPAVNSESELRTAMSSARTEKHRIVLNSVHPQGSLPMSTDPSRGVTNPAGELWEEPGIFVADASLFPTSIGVPPQVTIMALATAVAEEAVVSRP